MTRLRPAREGEQLPDAPVSSYEDWGEPLVAGAGERLLVTDADDTLLGSVSWRQVMHGPTAGSSAFEIGIALLPTAQGQGHGARAQRLLADWLFATTSVHRVQASTDVENAAEQGALRRAGFAREGVLRQAQWRLGSYHDLVLFSRLRTDA